MKRQIYVPRVSFPTLFLGILKEMIETNFSVSVWHILKQLFTSVPLEVEDIHPTA